MPSEPGFTLDISDLSVIFGGMHALSDVTVRVRSGTVHALIGPNGAGKTTLLNVISGFVRAAHGHVRLADVELTGMPAHRRNGGGVGVGRTFQHSALFEHLSVLENVLVGGERVRHRGALSQRDLEQKALGFLDDIGLSRAGNDSPAALPGGQRRLVGLARALMGEPRLLLLDEISAGMSGPEKEVVHRLIRDFRSEDRIVLVIEHDLDFVRQASEEASVLDRGKLIARGDTDSVLRDPKVVEAYVGT